MKKILITGSNGQVGWELQRSLSLIGKCYAFDKGSLNLEDSDQIRHVIRKISPDIIVNAAAYTAVDKAESEVHTCLAINHKAPAILAEEAKKLKAILVHFSTDYIFDGTSTRPYREDDPTNPLNVYGDSKLKGEMAIKEEDGDYFIFRTSWVYGSRGKNFLLTILKLAQERETLKIVNDQIGAPTWCRSIAEATTLVLYKCLIEKENLSHLKGTYNLTCIGDASWLDFAQEILQNYTYPDKPSPKLIGIPSSDYPTPAARPKNSMLDPNKFIKTFGFSLPNWEKALQLCLGEMS